MADAKKCDRCGKFYTENTVQTCDEFGNKCNVVKIKVIGDNGGIISHNDLCDDCVWKFDYFMNKMIKKGDGNEVSEM